MRKKGRNYCLRLMLLLFMFTISSVSVYATQSRTENFNKTYSLGSNQAENLVNVALKQVGKRKANLGYTEPWCADFVCDCAKLTGMADNIIPYNYASRGACTYLYNYMLKNCSAKEVSSRQKGDIVFYYCSGCGRYVHTGIVLDGTYTIEGNYGGKVTQVKNSYTDSAGHTLASGTVTRRYLRPNYSNISVSAPSIAGTYWGNMSTTTFRPVVVINNPESIKSVRFAVWTTADQSDLKWYDANYNGQKEYFKDINNSDFKNKIYICHVYVYGRNGSVKAIEMERLDRNNYPKPSIKGAYWGSNTDTTFRPVVVINNPESIKTVRFAVWTTGDQSDLKWYDANYNGVCEYFKDIRYSDLKNQKYFCHAYVYGKDESTQSIALDTFDTYNAEGNFESAEGGIGSISIRGWAFDRSDPKESVYIHCYAKDSTGKATLLGGIKANLERPDVNAAYSVGNNHGFSEKFITSLSGTYTIEASAINIGGGKEVTFLGAKTVTIVQPTLYFDSCGGTKCASRKVVNGQKYGKLPVPVRSGYIFNGWYTAKEGGQKITEEKEVSLTDNKTLYGHWIKTCEHKNTELRNKKEATCTAEGYTGDTYCKDCGAKLQTGKAIAKKAHTWNAGKITQEATCAKTGIKTYTCTVCKTTKTEEVPATGVHKNTELRNVKEATCTEEGYTGDTYCKDCGSKIASGQKVNKTEHTWNSGVVTTPPTCIERGVKTYTCIVCKTTKTEELPATGNHQNTELRNTKEASCTAEGYTGDIYCKDCGVKLQTGKTIAKKAHTWDAGVITTPATCTEKGVKTYTCTSCGGTKTNELPSTGHKQKEVRNKKAATCMQSGYTGDTYCKDCGKKLSSGKTIAKLAHKWDAGVITQEATCTEAGIKTYTCTVCESTRIEELPANGHGETVTKFAKEATCKMEGYTGDLYCKDCGELLEEGSVIAKLPHQWDAGKITKKATTTATGIRTYTCTKCGATKKETIPKIVPKKATPGKTVKDTATNGIYKVLADGLTVTFVRPAAKRATVRIPETVKVSGVTCKVTEISANAFKNNAVLKTVIVGKNVKTIGVNAFYGCKNLTKVSGGAALVTICDRAFSNCAVLSGIVLPSTVKGIGKQAFYNCKKLRSITINTLSLTSKNVGAQAFTGTYAKAVVKVPAKKFAAYKSLLRAKGMNVNAVYSK